MDLLAQIGQWAWFVVWAALLIAASLLVYIGLGGNFIVLALVFFCAGLLLYFIEGIAPVLPVAGSLLLGFLPFVYLL